MSYKLGVLDLDGKQKWVTRKSDGASIPFNLENADYQEYLEWLKIDGNVPEEAD